MVRRALRRSTPAATSHTAVGPRAGDTPGRARPGAAAPQHLAALRALAAALIMGAAPGLPVTAQSIAAARPSSAPGASGAAATLRAVPRDGDIVLDGRLDEPAWARAPVAREFTQSWPNPDQPPTDSMNARVLFDDAALYVGIRMYDEHPDSIAAQLARRDPAKMYSDWVHLVIDSYHDRRTAFRFSVNPRGVQKDAYTSNDTNEDFNWDAVWQVATRIDSLGWVAEYRVPLSQLRYGSAGPAEARVWGLQIMRDVARRSERNSFAPMTHQSPGYVSGFGTLTGLGAIPSPRRLDILPYASTKATRAPGSPSNPFHEATAYAPSIGGDVRYGLPGGLTLSATVNPDFGQVELDPAQVNLSAFETFFAEKRPFFLEGSDVFSFGNLRTKNSYGSATFLYSRRIGRTPARAVALGTDPRIAFADIPEQARILGAAKVTGKRGPWTVGFLDAVTDREVADVVSPAGTRSTTPVEPRTNYFAGRLRRDYRDGQTVVGAMLSGAVRDLDDDVFRPILVSRAGFGGIDFEHSWNDRSYFLSGYVAQSLVDGSATAVTSVQRGSAHYFQRPDADHLGVKATRTSLGGSIAALALQKTGKWFGSATVQQATPGFEINDVGFHGRVDYRALSTLFGYSSSEAGKHIRQRSISASQSSAWNFGGNSILQSVNGVADLTFTNLWVASARVGVQPERMDDRLLRGGPLAGAPRGWSASASVTSDTRKPFVGSLSYSGSGDASGMNTTSLGLSGDIRPATSVRVTLSPSLGIVNSTSQYVRGVADALATNTYGTRHVLADLHQTTLSLDTRVEWTLSPRLSFQTYVQPFVSTGRYADYKEFVAPRRYDFAVYGRDRGTIARDAATRLLTIDPDGPGAAKSFVVVDPTFNTRSLRGNAVLRWEYRPGSTLFLVWQQQRSDFGALGDFDAARDVGAIFRTRPTNVLAIKATYWLSP